MDKKRNFMENMNIYCIPTVYVRVHINISDDITF